LFFYVIENMALDVAVAACDVFTVVALVVMFLCRAPSAPGSEFIQFSLLSYPLPL
jgi:hypothetical protein